VIRFLYDYWLWNWHRLLQHHVLCYVHWWGFQNSGCQSDVTFTISYTCQRQPVDQHEIFVKVTVNVIVIKYPRIFKMYIKQTRVEMKEYNSYGKMSQRYLLTLLIMFV